ncbi:hypothetical protein KPH14_004068 [Odynerus spinipes]|uniref:Uncharacterized protein n=1 Tax=Odynerus spinipes TaxID=1348599 RepID=A0AAD9RZD7_9HYME|nr:hypothetical protein KPH14_004068 [Odynerus spinipes]
MRMQFDGFFICTSSRHRVSTIKGILYRYSITLEEVAAAANGVFLIYFPDNSLAFQPTPPSNRKLMYTNRIKSS